MKKLCVLAIFAISFFGCGPVQKEEQEAQKTKQDSENSTIIFHSVSDDFMGFYEMDSDSLMVLAQDNDENYHYYVYDSISLIAEGNYECVSCYDCTKQWSKCAILIFVEDPNLSNIQFILSSDESGINLSECSVSDNAGHEYWACSSGYENIINRATSHVTYPIVEGFLDYLYAPKE